MKGAFEALFKLRCSNSSAFNLSVDKKSYMKVMEEEVDECDFALPELTTAPQ